VEVGFNSTGRLELLGKPSRKYRKQLRTQLGSTIAVITLVAASGCAVHRGQEVVGAYVDDAAITTSLKARYVDNKDVDASSIKVETLNGTVMLSGFARIRTSARPPKTSPSRSTA
jgi:osmotically-inducible protein OsmY